jgi:rhodanese-related sulfurtransferase
MVLPENNLIMALLLQEVVNGHISKLQSQVGLKSGTIQELSNKHLQVRDRLQKNKNIFVTCHAAKQ